MTLHKQTKYRIHSLNKVYKNQFSRKKCQMSNHRNYLQMLQWEWKEFPPFCFARHKLNMLDGLPLLRPVNRRRCASEGSNGLFLDTLTNNLFCRSGWRSRRELRLSPRRYTKCQCFMETQEGVNEVICSAQWWDSLKLLIYDDATKCQSRLEDWVRSASLFSSHTDTFYARPRWLTCDVLHVRNQIQTGISGNLKIRGVNPIHDRVKRVGFVFRYLSNWPYILLLCG